MEFVNATNLDAGWTLGFERDGRELAVVAAKGTFIITGREDEPVWSESQVPLVQADEFSGEPGTSAPLCETDYAHRKPYCDVLVNGSAHAPQGHPTTRVTVGLHVGPVKKFFDVVGDRMWRSNAAFATPSEPVAFTRMPISYERAYGGSDADPEYPEKRKTFADNPIGVGYYPLSKGDYLDGKPLPNTCAKGRSTENPAVDQEPCSFGPLGRNFGARVKFAGTYDQAWLERQAPFWPDDFDYRYFQSAPPDQQMPYANGGERVTLHNLAPEPVLSFLLPRKKVPVLFVPQRGEAQEVEAVIDTILVEPDRSRFMLTWRVAWPLRRNCFELKEIVTGGRSRSWHVARRAAAQGKRYYRSLEELARERRAR